MSQYDTSLRRYAEPQDSDYINICLCHNPDRFLRYDVKDKKYYGVCGCKKEFACARLQINKHKIVLTSRKRRLLDPTFGQNKKINKNLKSPADQTLDQFFAK